MVKKASIGIDIGGTKSLLALFDEKFRVVTEVKFDVAKIKSSNLAAAIKAGDKVIEDLVRSRARIIGIALSNLVDFIDPDVVVLGGGLIEAMPELMHEEIRRGIKNHASDDALKHLRVVVSKLGSHAVTAGAAKLAVDSASREGHASA